MKFDKVDLSILNLIQEDSTITIKEMAKRLNVSTTPIFERLKRLEKQGVIQKYVALLNPKKVGKKLQVFVDISVVDHRITAIDDFVAHIEKFPEIMECYHITGEADFLLKIVVEDIDVYNEFVTRKLSTVPNIGKIRSSFSLSTKKKLTAFNL